MLRSTRPFHRLLSSSSSIAIAAAFSLRYLSSVTPTNPSPFPSTRSAKDSYFALIHHITNIMKHDLHPERSLNKLRLPVTSELVFRVLRATSSSPSASLRFFSWARLHYSPTSLELEQLLKTLACHRHFSSMWSLITQLRNPPNPFRKTNPNPQSFSLSPDTVCFIIEEYGKHGLIDHAVEVFNKCTSLLNCEQNVSVYNSMLFSLCEVKLFHGAYALIRRMIRKGLDPDKRTYSILVNAWCSSGKLKEAKEFLEEMSRKGFNPPVRGRDLLVEGLLNAGYFESAKEMVRKMIKEGVVPDVGVFNTVVETVCKSGEVEFCVELYHGVCSLGFVPDLNSYKILIPAVSKDGRIDEAFKLLHNAIEAGHRPFPSLYAPIIKGMCKVGQFDDAFGFFSDMKVKGHPPNRPVYTMLITMCGRGGKYIEAANYLMEMTEMGMVPISRCFDMVSDGLKNCGKHDLAKKIQQLEVSLNGS